jgi:hypothetical protein
MYTIVAPSETVSFGGVGALFVSADGKAYVYRLPRVRPAVEEPPQRCGVRFRIVEPSGNRARNDRFQSYSVAPDGKRFLMIQRDPGSVPRQLNLILDWR